MKKILSLGAMLFAAGCVSGPPEPIAMELHENPSLTRVRLDIDSYIGRDVRWGGVISKIENRADKTWVEIVQLELRGDGSPISGGSSDGRFIASFDRFLDPVVYEVGRRLTVVGAIDSAVQRPIGDYDYLFPVVAVQGSYLWKAVEYAPAPVYPAPWWYYDPWYPYPYPWPYHRHPYYR
ncbi:MAG: Slp family lipoprotein [Gammaproteobacteria bacterium]